MRTRPKPTKQKRRRLSSQEVIDLLTKAMNGDLPEVTLEQKIRAVRMMSKLGFRTGKDA